MLTFVPNTISLCLTSNRVILQSSTLVLVVRVVFLPSSTVAAVTVSVVNLC